MAKLNLLLFLVVFSFFTACSDSGKDSEKDPSEENGKEEITGETEGFVTAGGRKSGENTNGDMAPGADEGADYGDNGGDVGDTGSSTDSSEGAPSDSKDDGAEREIAEADIYKVAGGKLWVLNRYRGLVAVDVFDSSKLSILGRVSFSGVPHEMYVGETKAYILLRKPQEERYLVDDYYNYGAEGGDVAVDSAATGMEREVSEVVVVNISDPAEMSIVSRFEMDGAIVDSRMVGDVIYAAASRSEYFFYGCDDVEERGENKTTLISLHLESDGTAKLVSEVDVPGSGLAVYVSQKSIYVGQTDNYHYEDGKEGWEIRAFDISDPSGEIKKRGELSSRGFVKDRWKMFEKDNTFFVVSSTRWEGNWESVVEAFDVSDGLKKLGELVFMEGQELHATRFIGERLYAVTYFRQDPLHVIDISDPSNLIELGQLEIPGWSTHIEYRAERLLAVGVDDQGNGGVKVAMFDVSDPEKPTEMSTVSISDDSGYTHSEANNDWKAFKIYDQLGLILLPTTTYNYERGGAQFNLNLIDFDLEKGLKKRGAVESGGPVRRGVVVDKNIVSVGETELILVDPTDRDRPKVLSTLVMANLIENVHNCNGVPCGIFRKHYEAGGRLAIYSPGTPNEIKWMSERKGVWGSYLKVHSDKAYLINSRDYYTPETDGGYPEEKLEPGIYIDTFSLKKENADYSGRSRLVLPEIGENYYGYSYQKIEIGDEGKVLVNYMNTDYRCSDGTQECDWSEMHYEVISKPAVYDLSKSVESGDYTPIFLEELKPLSTDAPVIYKNGKFYLTSCENSGSDGEQQLLKCYLRTVSTEDPQKPAYIEKVNIPGELVGMNGSGSRIYTVQREWSEAEDSVYRYSFYVLIKSGEKVKTLKKIELKDERAWEDDKYTRSYNRFHFSNSTFFIASFSHSYDTKCSYYHTKISGNVKVETFDAVSGDSRGTIELGSADRIDFVKGGGVLVKKDDDKAVYIHTDGKKVEFNFPQATFGNDWSYYYENNRTALVGDNLYISRGWEDILKVDITARK